MRRPNAQTHTLITTQMHHRASRPRPHSDVPGLVTEGAQELRTFALVLALHRQLPSV